MGIFNVIWQLFGFDLYHVYHAEQDHSLADAFEYVMYGKIYRLEGDDGPGGSGKLWVNPKVISIYSCPMTVCTLLAAIGLHYIAIYSYICTFSSASYFNMRTDKYTAFILLPGQRTSLMVGYWWDCRVTLITSTALKQEQTFTYWWRS